MNQLPSDLSPEQFYKLTPDFVIQAVESSGFFVTGEYLQLNSYENRVYRLSLENPLGEQVIAKFYRPGRWSKDAIQEEHDFLDELNQLGIHAVAPLRQKNGKTISEHAGIYCALFKKFVGRMPQELSLSDLSKLGRLIAQVHNVGAAKKSKYRPIIDGEHMGRAALNVVSPRLPSSIKERYLNAADEILDWLESDLDVSRFQRIHGDCHRGNVLMLDQAGKPPEFFLVDFDDFGMGPVVQDFWMLFRHDEDDIDDEVSAFLSGYTELRDFDEDQLELMGPLRGLRILHYAAWIAKRWNDPSFPQIFPHFDTEAYWFDELKALESTLS